MRRFCTARLDPFRNFELASVSRELVEKFSKRTLQIERLARDNFTKVDARARALMKETGLDYADAYAKVKHDLGAESRENDAETYLQRMQEVLARNTFQAKRTANLQHGIEPPLGPTLKEAAPEQDAARLAELRRQAMERDRPQRPDRDRGHSIGM